MENLKISEEFNINDVSQTVDSEISFDNEFSENTMSENSLNNTEMIEYKEIEEPCVALTIVGENKLTDAEVFVKRGLRYSVKAFFSTLILTIMNMFI